MTDELLLALSDMANISPKKVRLIINPYENAKTVTVPEGYIAFEYEGKRYVYKPLGDGPWRTECANVELMKVLKNHFLTSGEMKEGGCWPGSRSNWVWTSVGHFHNNHIVLYSGGNIFSSCDDAHYARFAVIPQDSE